MHDRFHLAHGIGAFHLGNDHGMGAGTGGGGDIVMSPGVARPLTRITSSRDPETTGLERRAYLLAGDVLGIGSDCVFQIEDVAIGTQGADFSRARALDPGMYSTLRRGRTGLIIQASP